MKSIQNHYSLEYNNATLDQKEKPYLKKLLFCQIFNSVFILIILIIAFSQHHNILNIDGSIILFYILSIILYCFTIIIIYIINLRKCEKECLLKKVEWKFGENLIVLIISLILLGMISITVDNQKDIEKFLPNSSKTVGNIYDIRQYINYHQRTSRWSVIDEDKRPRRDFYKVSYKYYVYYVINGKDYETTFNERDNLDYHSKSRAENSSPKHNKGEEITIYYNKDNPKDIRLNVNTHSNLTIYIFEIVIILLQSYSLIKIILVIRKTK